MFVSERAGRVSQSLAQKAATSSNCHVFQHRAVISETSILLAKTCL